MKEKVLDQNMVEKMLEKKNKIFIESLVTHLMRCGKKPKAKGIIINTGLLLGKQTNKKIFTIYYDIFNKIRPFVEVKKVRVRRTTYMVPFPTNLQRQKHLSAQWILETVRKDKRKLSFNIKFKEEIIKILLNRGATLEKKREMYKKAEKSRSFMHFRWY